MKTAQESYTEKKWPPSRNVVVDAAYFASKRHLVHALIEVDVTEVRKFIRQKKSRQEPPPPQDVSFDPVEHAREKDTADSAEELRVPIKQSNVTGTQSVSFTAFLLKCVTQAVQQHPMMQAYRSFWGTKLIIPHSVDIATMIEVTKNGVAVPEIIRRVQDKSVYEISDEIRAVQWQPRKKSKQLPEKYWGKMPTLVRRFAFQCILCRPKWIHKMMGTVAVSSMGMFGKDSGSDGGSAFAIGYVPFHTMGVFVGGIAMRPRMVSSASSNETDGTQTSTNLKSIPVVEEREYLSLTVTFDHDIIDGAPAARFVSALKHEIESGVKFL